MESGRMEGKEEWENQKKKKQGDLVCKPDTLAVTVNKQTERKTGGVVGGVRVREMERKEGKEDGWNKRETQLGERWNDGEREKKKRNREEKKMERGFTFSRPLGAIGPVCYGLFIPLAPITTQWAALFSSTQYNNSWAILAWHTTGGTPKVGQRKEHDLK